ncbi:MAG: AraC family transcriptional regulator [Citrobacter freundii]|nr:MAG: AraC family transcriptional regulator [Citrobacter freundii]
MIQYRFMTSATSSLNQNIYGAAAGAATFEMHMLEWLFQHRRDPVVRLRNYEMIWVKSGRGHLIIDHVEMELLPGNVYLLRPGQYRSLQPVQGMEGYYLSLEPDFFHLSGSEALLLLNNGCNAFEGPLVIKTDEEVRVEAEDILMKIRREFTYYGSTRQGILKGLFRIFILYLSQKMDQVTMRIASGAEKDLVSRFMDSLKKHFSTKKMVSDYADEFCVTPGHLNRIVKKISGFPVSYHIQQQIVLEAKRLAYYSDRSMKEIAYLLGFEDLAHFSKFFKNNSGMNFSNFKKMTAGM